MSAQSGYLCDKAVSVRTERGFSVVELMIALVLGVILISGVIGVFVTTSRSFNTNEALSEVQTNARIAFEWLASDIRQAGLLGCDSGVSPTNTLGTGWWADWDNVIRGYESAQTDPVNTTRVAGTDSLVMVGAQGIAYSVKDNATFTDVELVADGEFSADDNVIICDPGSALIARVDSYSAGTKTITLDDGGTTLSYPYPKNSMVSFYGANAWYIGTNPQGGRSLYRRSKEKGVSGVLNNEMVRGVTDMQLRFHRRNQTQFETADVVGTRWSQVDAVEVTLTLESSQNASVDKDAIERTFSVVTALRNRVR